MSRWSAILVSKIVIPPPWMTSPIDRCYLTVRKSCPVKCPNSVRIVIKYARSDWWLWWDWLDWMAGWLAGADKHFGDPWVRNGAQDIMTIPHVIIQFDWSSNLSTYRQTDSQPARELGLSFVGYNNEYPVGCPWHWSCVSPRAPSPYTRP